MHKVPREFMEITKSVIDFKSKICLHYRFVNIIMKFCSGFNEKKKFLRLFFHDLVMLNDVRYVQQYTNQMYNTLRDYNL